MGKKKYDRGIKIYMWYLCTHVYVRQMPMHLCIDEYIHDMYVCIEEGICIIIKYLRYQMHTLYMYDVQIGTTVHMYMYQYKHIYIL